MCVFMCTALAREKNPIIVLIYQVPAMRFFYGIDSANTNAQL